MHECISSVCVFCYTSIIFLILESFRVAKFLRKQQFKIIIMSKIFSKLTYIDKKKDVAWQNFREINFHAKSKDVQNLQNLATQKFPSIGLHWWHHWVLACAVLTVYACIKHQINWQSRVLRAISFHCNTTFLYSLMLKELIGSQKSNPWQVTAWPFMVIYGGVTECDFELIHMYVKKFFKCLVCV